MARSARDLVKDALNKMAYVFDSYIEIARGFTSWRSRPWAISRLGRRGVILDLGAGACINGVYAYKLGGRYLLCIDVSYTMSFLSRRNLVKESVLGDGIAGDMLFLPLRDNSIDSVIAIASLHHIPPELIHIVIKEIVRVAVDGALVVITTWSWRQPRFVLPTLINVVLRLLCVSRDVREYLVPWRRSGRTIYRYYRLYTLEELLDFCKRYGLRVISYGYTGYLKKKSDNVYIVAKVVK